MDDTQTKEEFAEELSGIDGIGPQLSVALAKYGSKEVLENVIKEKGLKFADEVEGLGEKKLKRILWTLTGEVSEGRIAPYTKKELAEELELDGMDPRQMDLLVDYINNFFRDRKDRKSKRQMKKDAGYKPNSNNQWLEKKARPIVRNMVAERLRALQLMGEKANDASYRDLTLAVDKLTTNIELLLGKPTERKEKEGLKLTDEQYDKLFKLEAERRGWEAPEEAHLIEEPEGDAD